MSSFELEQTVHLSSSSETPPFQDLPFKDWPPQQTTHTAETGLQLIASDGELVQPHPPRYRTGEAHLPVALYRDEYLEMVHAHRKVVVSAKTGSGKSTSLGLYALEDGASVVYVSEPRRLSTKELKDWTRQKVGDKYAHLVGNLTGDQSESDCPPAARLIFVTQDLLFKMVTRGDIPDGAHIIIDEAHEKGKGTIFLLDQTQELVDTNPSIAMTVTSATIDEQKFAENLGGAPILRIPGQIHEITESVTDDKVPTIMRQMMKRPHEKNVLAFEPSVARMRKTRDTANARLSDHTVHALYGDQSPLEQTEALNPADKHHIVATRVGEASITPENKDVVVDSTLSMVGGFVAGVHMLSAVWSSKATMTQRKGRVGRTKPGEYIVAQPEDAPPRPAYDDRPDYEPSEIENSSVASYLLELRRAGIRIQDRKLFERPTAENLRYDETLLRRLGAIPLHDDDGTGITEIGVAMTDLGLDAPQARMVVEARAHTLQTDGTQSDAVRLQVAGGVAVQQVNGLLDTGPGTKNRYMGNGLNKPLSNEQSSDFLFELDVFSELMRMQRAIEATGSPDTAEQVDRLLKRYDILPNRYYKAVKIFEELCRRETLDATALVQPDKDQRTQIVDCQIVATPELFVQRGKRVFTDIRGDRGRLLGKHTTINNALGSMIVGTAFNYRGLTRNGPFEKRMISGGSQVTAEQLAANAPNRLTRQAIGYGVNRRGRLVQRQAMYFDGVLNYATLEAALPPTAETRVALITAMMTGQAPNLDKPSQSAPYRPGTPNAIAALKKWQYAQTIEERSQVKLNISSRYESLVKKAIRASLAIDENGQAFADLDITDPAVLDQFIPKVFVSSLVKPTRRKRTLPNIAMTSPDGISVHVGEEEKDYVDVHYKSRVAYISIPRDCKFTIKREDFAALASNHDVKIRIANGRYAQLEAMFEKIDSERDVVLKRDQQRAERRAEMAKASVRTIQSTERKAQQQREREESERSRKVMQLAARAREVRSNRKAKKLARYALENV